MAAYILRLDPALPLCWENGSTLRFGFDRAEARVHNPSLPAQRFISMLRKGISSSDLTHASRRIGLSAQHRSELLATLAPILTRSELAARAGPPARPTIAILGTGALAFSIEHTARRSGFSLAKASELPSFAVIIERFLEPAAHAHKLLIEHVPHLSVRMSDRSASLGPLVAPGGAPCLSCVELHGLQSDPLAPLLAAQLFLEAPRICAESCVEMLAALTISAIDNWFQGNAELRGTRLRFDLRNGRLSHFPAVQEVLPHAECGCVALSEEALAA